MRCCPNCFCDPIAADIVRELAHDDAGDCDFCGSRDVPVVELSPECELYGYFEAMLEVFGPVSESVMPSSPLSPQPLAHATNSLWNIFAIDTSKIEEFLCAMFEGEGWYAELTSHDVVVAPHHGQDDFAKYSLFGSGTWERFVDSIKHDLRFHTRIENEGLFEQVCRAISRLVQRDELWYRARTWNKDSHPQVKDLREAPTNATRNGRMNVAGIPCLYIADSPLTAIAETRASAYDVMAVASIRSQRELEIVDLSRVHAISPFDEIDCCVLAANVKNLQLLRTELLWPMRQTDPELDYLPTEYISDLIKSFGFDGIGYKSVMNKGDGQMAPGFNIASFRRIGDGLEIEDIDLYRVDHIDYAYSAIE